MSAFVQGIAIKHLPVCQAPCSALDTEVGVIWLWHKVGERYKQSRILQTELCDVGTDGALWDHRGRRGGGMAMEG